MQIEYMREFCEFARYLNVTRAANGMGIAQSNLSKHIKQLEDDVGWPLIQMYGGRVFLTRTGAMFLNRAQMLVDFYDRLGAECRNLDTKALPVISAQLPALVDKGAATYNALLDDLRANKPLLQVRFLRTSFSNLKSSLVHSSLDILLSYHCGNVRDIVTDYTDRGFSALHLCSEPLVIWCGKKHPLTRIKPKAEDLRNVPIMTPVDSAAPMRRAASEFCRSHGFMPRFSTVDTPTQAEFHAAYLQSSIFLYPKSFTESKRIRKFTDMVAVPFKDEELVHAFAVTYPNESEASQQLDEFISHKKAQLAMAHDKLA